MLWPIRSSDALHSRHSCIRLVVPVSHFSFLHFERVSGVLRNRRAGRGEKQNHQKSRTLRVIRDERHCGTWRSLRQFLFVAFGAILKGSLFP